MAIGELLLAKGIITESQLKTVLQQQKIAGGRVGDNLVALGYITRQDLETILQEPPRSRRVSPIPGWTAIFF